MSMVITTTTVADYRLVLPLYIDIINILYMSMPLYACSMASLPVLVYCCCGVTAPHTGLAYVLQRLSSFPVNPSGRRYFWKRHCVYGDFFQKRQRIGLVWTGPMFASQHWHVFTFSPNGWLDEAICILQALYLPCLLAMVRSLGPLVASLAEVPHRCEGFYCCLQL